MSKNHLNFSDFLKLKIIKIWALYYKNQANQILIYDRQVII